MADTQALQSPGISHVVQLEQWLMEGAYNKVLDARPKLPDPAYGYFMEKLLSTVRWGAPLSCQSCAQLKFLACTSHPFIVLWDSRGTDRAKAHGCRDEIADCSKRAYKKLSIKDAKKLMLFGSDQEATAYAAQVTPCGTWHHDTCDVAG